MSKGAHVITVVYDELEQHDGKKGLFAVAAARASRVGPLDTTALEANLTDLSMQLSSILQHIDTPQRGFGLREFEVTVELTGRGDLRLIGSVGAEVKGGLRLTFSRV